MKYDDEVIDKCYEILSNIVFEFKIYVFSQVLYYTLNMWVSFDL